MSLFGKLFGIYLTADDSDDMVYQERKAMKEEAETKRTGKVGQKDGETPAKNAKEVKKRIYSFVEENYFGNIQICENISPAQLNAPNNVRNCTLGFYYDNRLIAVVNILRAGEYNAEDIQMIKEVCATQSIGYAHFMLHLPNRKSYIDSVLSKLIVYK